MTHTANFVTGSFSTTPVVVPSKAATAVDERDDRILLAEPIPPGDSGAAVAERAEATLASVEGLVRESLAPAMRPTTMFLFVDGKGRYRVADASLYQQRQIVVTNRSRRLRRIEINQLIEQAASETVLLACDPTLADEALEAMTAPVANGCCAAMLGTASEVESTRPWRIQRPTRQVRCLAVHRALLPALLSLASPWQPLAAWRRMLDRLGVVWYDLPV